MSRRDATFDALRARGERALVVFFTAGDPSMETTARLCIEAERRGADVIELGVPFSDPIADGPVIQRAGQRALAAGTSLRRVLDLMRTLRGEVSVPIVFFTYYNPLLAFGIPALAETAGKVGVDGVLAVDVPPEESVELSRETRAAGMDLIHLASPTSTPERLRLIGRLSRGFVYL